MTSDSTNGRKVEWRSTIDSLAFRPEGHDGLCVVHRRAFETLLQAPASPAQCMAYFAEHQPTFEAAAAGKISRAGLKGPENLHLTSRDIARSRPQSS